VATVQGFDDAFEALVIFAAPDAHLHPAGEGPQREDENPKFHGGSGLG